MLADITEHEHLADDLEDTHYLRPALAEARSPCLGIQLAVLDLSEEQRSFEEGRSGQFDLALSEPVEHQLDDAVGDVCVRGLERCGCKPEFFPSLLSSNPLAMENHGVIGREVSPTEVSVNRLGDHTVMLREVADNLSRR
jgi:hypothetical protein